MDRVEEAVGRRKAHTFRGVKEKRRIVEKTLRAGASVSSVAHVYKVNANQVFQWRRLCRDGLLDAAPSGDGTRLLPVALSDESKRFVLLSITHELAPRPPAYVDTPGLFLIASGESEAPLWPTTGPTPNTT